MRELEKIKKERQAQKEKEVCIPPVLLLSSSANDPRNKNELLKRRKNGNTTSLEAIRYSMRRISA